MRIKLRNPRLLAFVLPALALSYGPEGAWGQEGAFAFHISGGQGVPVGRFASEERGWEGKSRAGPAFGMGFSFPGPGPLMLFLGFGQRRFPCDESACPAGADWTSTGYDVALRYVVGEGRVRAWMQGGIHTHRVEGEGWSEEGETYPLLSDGGTGSEVGGGVLIGIGERTSLAPGLRYGRGRAPLRNGRILRPRYLLLELGLVLGF
jgi:hypothetical protein